MALEADAARVAPRHGLLVVYGAHTDGSYWEPAHSRPRDDVYLVSRAAWLCNDSPFMLRAQSQKIRRAFIAFASRSFSRLLALHFHALKLQLATSPAVSAPSYHFPFHNSIFVDLSTLYFRRPSLCPHLAFLFFPR